MSGQTQSHHLLVVNSELSKHVISEYDLLRILNMERPALDKLRWGGDFPVVYLSRSNRVYLVKDLLDWLESHKGYKLRGTAKRSDV